jgi:hypothetical protein
MNGGDDFLLGRRNGDFHSQTSQILQKLVSGREHNAMKSQFPGGFDVYFDVVDVDGF